MVYGIWYIVCITYTIILYPSKEDRRSPGFYVEDTWFRMALGLQERTESSLVADVEIFNQEGVLAVKLEGASCRKAEAVQERPRFAFGCRFLTVKSRGFQRFSQIFSDFPMFFR